MKKVFSSNSELIHVWANNNEPEIYKSANSVSCQYERLFSYNTCIAEIVNDTHVILNNHSYSNTTAKHQSMARQAIHGREAISLDIDKYNLSTLIFGQGDFERLIVRHNEAKAAEWLVKASRSKKYAGLYNGQALSIFSSLKAYADLFGLTYETSISDIDILRSDALEAEKKQKALDKIRKAEKIAEQAEALIKWRAGENVYHNFEVTALRVHGDEIQTSRGARIPLAEAVRAWPLLQKIASSGEALRPENMRLGYYQVSSISSEALIVGCHVIPMAEVLNVASALNLN
jgi:hypothetical protein